MGDAPGGSRRPLGSPHTLVAGAGYTGSRLLEALPAGSALGIRRSAGAAGSQPLLLADFDGEMPALPAAAVIVYTVPPPREGEDDPRLGRFLGQVAENPRRIVYFSTSGVYGDCGGARVDEDAPLAPRSARARRRIAAEARLADWCRSRGVELSVLRVPGIYGPGRLGLERLRDGEPVLRREESGPGNRIHVSDLVACALAASDLERPAGIYNVGDGDCRSAAEFAADVARLAGLRPPREISMAEARRVFSPMRLSFLDESRRVDVTRMRSVLGVTPRYADPLDGIRASLGEEQPG